MPLFCFKIFNQDVLDTIIVSSCQHKLLETWSHFRWFQRYWLGLLWTLIRRCWCCLIAGKGKVCTEQSCDNSGVCLQQPDGYVCNCEMTSYVGPTCKDGNTSRKRYYCYHAYKGLTHIPLLLFRSKVVEIKMKISARSYRSAEASLAMHIVLFAESLQCVDILTAHIYRPTMREKFLKCFL